MYQGRPLREFAQEIVRVSKEKKDYLAGPGTLTFDANCGLKSDLGTWNLTEHCESQLATKLGIPSGYWARLKEKAPDLLESNVNRWLKDEGPRFIRTLDGKARAYLSDRYRVFDNSDLMSCVLPSINKTGAKVLSSEVTEHKLYFKFIFQSLAFDLGTQDKPDICYPGGCLTNSEVGAGNTEYSFFLYRQVCLNGMMGQSVVKKMHLGAKIDENFLSLGTQALTHQAFRAQMYDLISYTASVECIEKQKQEYLKAKESKKIEHPQKTIEKISSTFVMSDAEGETILKHLSFGGDFSQWGLANAVTRTAQDATNYDRATELERIGGKIIELTNFERII